LDVTTVSVQPKLNNKNECSHDPLSVTHKVSDHDLHHE
jgi:hypothetical protein